MVKFKATHDFKLKKENKEVKKGQEVDLTLKRVEEIHANLSKDSAWKHIVPVFVREEE